MPVKFLSSNSSGIALSTQSKDESLSYLYLSIASLDPHRHPSSVLATFFWWKVLCNWFFNFFHRMQPSFQVFGQLLF
jgi:Zn-dependent protease